MNRKRLIISVACGVGAALLMTWYASDVRAQATSLRQETLTEYGGEQVEVFVATRDIVVGETLNAANVSAQFWLADLLPAGALTEESEVYGKTLAVPLLENEPVIAAKLGDLATPVSVPDSLCAVSIPTEDVCAVGGAISAGSEVNVYAVGGNEVALLGQSVLVLETSNGSRAFGAEAQNPSGLFGSVTSRSELSWVTLAVAPERVQEYLAASRDDWLYLVLPGAGVPTLNTSVKQPDSIMSGPENSDSTSQSEADADESVSDKERHD